MRSGALMRSYSVPAIRSIKIPSGIRRISRRICGCGFAMSILYIYCLWAAFSALSAMFSACEGRGLLYARGHLNAI